jgi:hypothetical protein
MGPGGSPGLQNRVSGGYAVRGGFDSHTLPPISPVFLDLETPVVSPGIVRICSVAASMGTGPFSMLAAALQEE